MDLSYLQNESQPAPEQQTEAKPQPRAQKSEPALRKASGLVYETRTDSKEDPGVFSPNQYSLSTVEYAELREQPPDSESDSPMEHDYSPRLNSGSRGAKNGSFAQKSGANEQICDSRTTSQVQDKSQLSSSSKPPSRQPRAPLQRRSRQEQREQAIKDEARRKDPPGRPKQIVSASSRSRQNSQGKFRPLNALPPKQLKS